MSYPMRLTACCFAIGLLFPSLGEAAPSTRLLPRLELPSAEGFSTAGTIEKAVFLAQAAPAQPPQPSSGPIVIGPDGKPVIPGQNKPPKSGESKPGETKPGEEGKKPDDANKEGAQVVKRPTKPTDKVDPQELEVRPDADGRIAFNFNGQPWPRVLEWLADVSKLSLDWQELPDGFLNLRTQRTYSLNEAQDLINRHLLARGFTMLRSGEMLTVVNISKMNPALVPRISPEELEQQPDYDFVKVSFPLKWILAEKGVEEFKPMLSPNGNLTALKEVNRIEAMDAVVNLRDIYRTLQMEQSADATKSTVVREFKLKHRRASEVILLLETMLGLDNKKRPSGGGGGNRGGDQNAMMMQQMQQQMQQMQQQQQNQNRGNQPAGSSSPAQEPRLVVNERENSILANAPPDKMEIISQMVEAIDVPSENATQLLGNVTGVKSYRLSTIAPQPLLEILKELGDLSPQSRLQVDEKNSTLILFGTLSDHYTVQTLIQRLDGSTRKFDVIPLRRTTADQVAGTIQYMLSGKDDEKNKNNNRYGYFSFYGQQQTSNDNEEKRPFKVDADVEHNRLLVWANEAEMKEVYNLLAKMGEVVPGYSNPETVRTLELPSGPEGDKLLERVQQMWPDNRLQVLPGPEVKATSPSVPEPLQPAPAPREERPAASTSGNPGAAPQLPLQLALFGDDLPGSADHPLALPRDPLQMPQAAAGEPLPSRQSGQQPESPILLRRGPNGQVMIRSEDVEALDQLEDLINQLAPPRRDYKVFQLKYPNTYALDIEWILKDYFAEDDKKKTGNSYMDYWYGYSSNNSNDKGSLRMSQRKPLKIISDEPSKTVLVQGATPQQLAIIEDLISVYDRPTSTDPQTVRVTEYFTIKYSDAKTVGTTIKQVYRDLLSASDPALQPKQQGQNNEQRSITYNWGNTSSPKDRTSSMEEPRRFKGLLSVGVDEVSNTIVISAIGLLMPEIRELITRLDEAANPHTTIQVMSVQHADVKLMKEQFDKVFGFQANVRSSRTGDRRRSQNEDLQNQNGNQNNNQNNNNNNNRDSFDDF
ncbi:secretin N-terminal domain-containing protein [Planctomicrobium sp. SH664]|uniref:secretin N-terminal domain-containing protein n=1 Tax=Planctomicrobium sp. SH664 TaxID=3448125 RepID=UPI003F5C62F5